MVAPNYALKRQELAKKIGLGRKARAVAKESAEDGNQEAAGEEGSSLSVDDLPPDDHHGLALGLGMVRCAADVGDALALEPEGEVAREIGRTVVAEKPGAVGDPGAVAARGREGELEPGPQPPEPGR